MKFVTRITHHPQGHLGQQSHEASEDETEISTCEGILQLYSEVRYLPTKNAGLLQQIKELEEARNTFASSIPMKSDDTWRHQAKTYAATILFAQVKFILSQKFLDDLDNPFSLGNKTAHHFKIENKVSSFWMTYKQDVAFEIKQKGEMFKNASLRTSKVSVPLQLIMIENLPSQSNSLFFLFCILLFCFLFRYNN